jgi:hypothetical protein
MAFHLVDILGDVIFTAAEARAFEAANGCMPSPHQLMNRVLLKGKSSSSSATSSSSDTNAVALSPKSAAAASAAADESEDDDEDDAAGGAADAVKRFSLTDRLPTLDRTQTLAASSLRHAQGGQMTWGKNSARKNGENTQIVLLIFFP